MAGCLSLWRPKALTLALTLALISLVSLACANSEGDALYTLRRSLSDPDNVLQSWDPTLVNPCTWFHITCNQGNRVTRVDLGNSNLSGHLVPELGKLEHLQYLELYKNNIQGPIPVELGNLKSLISLDLYNNNISGNIPPSLGKLISLVFLRLNDNQLSGPIPRELVSVMSLKVVDVSNNNLCGTIPTSGPFEHFPLSKDQQLRRRRCQGLVAPLASTLRSNSYIGVNVKVMQLRQCHTALSASTLESSILRRHKCWRRVVSLMSTRRRGVQALSAFNADVAAHCVAMMAPWH